MKTEHALDLYQQYAEQQHMAGCTLRWKRKVITFFIQWMELKQIDDLRDVTFDDVRQYQAYLAKRRKPNGDLSSKAYQNSLLWTLNDFYTLLHQRGKVLLNPCAELPPLRKPRRLPRGVLTGSQVTRLLQAPDVKKPFGFRDRAMLELLYSSGLRGIEVCQLSLYDIDFDQRLVRIVQGKGRKDRLVPAGRTTLNYVAKYIEQVRPIHAARNRKGQGLTRLFLTILGTPFNTKYLYQQIKRYRRMADLGDTVTTHSLRHACATEMLRGGANVRHVQEMLGHAHLSTTQVYTHVVPHDLKKVHIETAPSERRRVIDVPKFQNKGWKDYKNGGYYRD
jgi:integrase/recombinase XerD